MNLKSIFTSTLITLAFGLAANTFAARNCSKGKACGNSCIAKDTVCHKDSGTAVTAPDAPASKAAPVATAPEAPAKATPAATTAGAAPAKAAKVCKKGKPCGDSCIPVKSECHQ